MPLELRGYQVRGAQHLFNIQRGFLTDEPGAGKTIQAATAMITPTMIVCPVHLKLQWHDFLVDQYPNIKVVCVIGSRKERERLLAKDADVYIINYEMIPTYDLPVFINTYIFDESHHLRNHTANKSRAAVLLANRNSKARVYMLSATPMWKSVDDIFMQLRVLFPTVFKTHREFVRTWCNTVEMPWGTKVVGLKKAMRGPMKSLLAPIMMGRTIKQLGRELPPIIESIITLDMPTAQRALYSHIQKEYNLKYNNDDGQRKTILFNAISVLHAFRQITFGCGKVEAVVQLIEDNNLQTIVGCWYKDHAKQIYDALPKGSAVYLTGDMVGEVRIQAALKAQKEGKHIVCTQASLTEGVNLYHFRQIIQVEEHYVPGSNDQFIKRVLRDRNDDGQDQTPILKYCIHVKRSVDEEIHRTAYSRSTSIKSVEEMLERVFIDE